MIKVNSIAHGQLISNNMMRSAPSANANFGIGSRSRI